MPDIETKKPGIQTRESGAVLTREAAKALESTAKSGDGASQRPQKGTAQAGRDATEQVEDAAKAKALQAAKSGARMLAAFKKRRAATPPPVMPDLKIPAPELQTGTIPPALQPNSNAPLPELPAAPPVTDGAAVLQAEPLRLWSAPESGQISTSTTPHSPPTDALKGVEQVKCELQIKQTIGGKETLFQPPQAGRERPALQNSSPNAPPPVRELRTGERPSAEPFKKSATRPKERPEITKAKKKLQISRFQQGVERRKRDLRERDQTGASIREGLFQGPRTAANSPAPVQIGAGQPQGKTIGPTLPGKEKSRVRALLGRTRQENPLARAVGGRARTQAKALAVRRAKQAARHAAGKTIAGKGGAALVKKLSIAVAAGLKALTAALWPVLGVGVAVLAVLILVAAAAAVLGSPFGILFANENDAPDTVPISTAVGQLNTEFSNYLTALQAPGYDGVEIHGAMTDWAEVLAVFAVKTAGRTTQALDVITMDPARVELLSAVFWDMNPVRTEVEVITSENEDGTTSTTYILHIYIGGKTAEEMADSYAFTRDQRQLLDELLTDYRELLAGLAADLTIPGGDASDVVAALPEDLNPARRAAVEKALSLVGKVGYFWGGKSYKIGWDDRWGTLQQVTAPGSSTSGTWIPYGLDCTGYLDWSFRNAGLPSAGHWYLETNLTETTWDEAQPGDIALFPDNSHVGLVVGRDGSGRVLVVHCSYSLNIIAVSDGRAFGFTKVGVPTIYEQ